MKGGAPLLRVCGLRAGYGGRPVLDGLDFCLDAGESLALLGCNGSGKTTLLRALSGVLPLFGGVVYVLGRPLLRLRPAERARLVAVVPQRARLPMAMTARQCVLLGRYAHLSWLGFLRRADHMAADRALEETGAAALAQRPLAELSGGEVQRVLLARALAQESPLLLLDELAAGLDLARMTDLFDLLDRRRAAGSGVLMALHDCNLAALYATRLMGLSCGRALFDGPVSHVFTEENLHALYGISLLVLPHPRLGLPQALLAGTSGPWAAPCAPGDLPASGAAGAAPCPGGTGLRARGCHG